MPVNYLRADDFESFMKERRKALLKLIASSTGHSNSDIIDSSAEGEEGCTGSCALSSHHGINVRRTLECKSISAMAVGW
jgi:hypothetical protein